MRKYNCKRYLSCLSQAATDDNDSLPCEQCKKCDIYEQRSDDPSLRECALACCRLLLELFEIREESQKETYRDFVVRIYNGQFFAVRRRPGEKRVTIALRNPDDAERKIDAYLSKGG